MDECLDDKEHPNSGLVVHKNQENRFIDKNFKIFLSLKSCLQSK